MLLANAPAPPNGYFPLFNPLMFYSVLPNTQYNSAWTTAGQAPLPASVHYYIGNGNYLYRQIVITNGGNAFDLTNGGRLLVNDQLLASMVNPNVLVNAKITAVYALSGTTWRRWANDIDTVQHVPNPIPSGYTDMPVPTGMFVNAPQIQLVDSILNYIHGDNTVSPGDTIRFWVEIKTNAASASTLCGNTFRYQTSCSAVIPNTTISNSACFNPVGATSDMFFADNGVKFAITTGKVDVASAQGCYNTNVDATTPLDSLHTDRYYMSIRNDGLNPADAIELAFAWRGDNTCDNNFTHYLMNNGTNGDLRAWVLNAPFTPSSGSLTPPATMVVASVPSGNIQASAFPDTLLSTGLTVYDYHRITVNANVSPGQYLFVAWDGYHELSESECTACYDNQSWQVWHDDPCMSGGVKYFGSISDLSGNNQNATWGSIVYVTPRREIHGASPLGPGISNIIGNPNDDYSSTAPSTASYTLPAVPTSLMPMLPTAAAYIVKIVLDPKLNIWKGDINNAQHRSLGNPLQTSNFYIPNHLSQNIRFLSNPAVPLGCSYMPSNPITPAAIFYGGNNTCNTTSGGFYVNGNYVSNGTTWLPTGNDLVGDTIYAVFNVNNPCDLQRYSNMQVEIDVEPVCNSGTQGIQNSLPPCANAPASTISYVGISPIEVSSFISPNRNCNANHADADIIQQAFGCNTCPNPPAVNSLPENIYLVGCPSPENIVVQCPGCHIVGLYNEGNQINRMTYGLIDSNDDNVADTPMAQIRFDQRTLSPNAQGLDSRSVMYGDLFRMRVKSRVYLDGPDYAPNDSDFLSLLPSEPNNGTKGFEHAYLRVAESTQKHTYIESFGYRGTSPVPNMNNSIPNLLVWIEYGSYNHNPSLNSNAAPICLFWDDSLDKVETYTDLQRNQPYHEFVFDVSMNRIAAAYSQQHNNAVLPFTLYHNMMSVYYDVTFRVKGNANSLAAIDTLPTTGTLTAPNRLELDTKAYFTLIPEGRITCADTTAGPVTDFIDLQEIDGMESNLAALKDLSTYMAGGSNYPVSTINGTTAAAYFDSLNLAGNFNLLPATGGINRLKNIRWWCVRGHSEIRLIGYEHTFGDWTKNSDWNVADYCTIGFTMPASSITSKFVLKNGGNPKSFQREYRNWSNLDSINLADTSGTSLTHTRLYVKDGNTTLNLIPPSPLPLNQSIQPFYNPETTIPVTNATPPLFRRDDGVNYTLMSSYYRYNDCGQSGPLCLTIQEEKQYHIPFLGMGALPDTNPLLRTGSFPADASASCSITETGIGNAAAAGQNCTAYPLPPESNHDSLILGTGAFATGAFAPVIFSNQLRSKYQTFNFVKPGNNGHLSISSVTATNFTGNGLAQWVFSVNNLNDTSMQAGMYVGNAPNPYILVRTSATSSWTPPASTTISLGGSNFVSPFSGRDAIINGEHYYLFSAITSNNQPVWTSYNFGPNPPITLPTSVTLNIPYNCINPPDTADIIEVAVGYSCNPSWFADTTHSLDGGFCEQSAWIPLPFTEANPFLAVVDSVQNGGASFLCDPSIINLKISNLGIGCLENLGTAITYDSIDYTLDTAVYTVGNISTTLSPPVPPATASYTLSNPNTPPACFSGLGGNTTGEFVIPVFKNCQLGYDSSHTVGINVHGQALCNGVLTDIPVSIRINPYLDNPDNTFNQLQLSNQSQAIDCANNTLVFGIQNLMTTQGVPGFGSIGANTLGGDNVLVLNIPAGISVTGGSIMQGSIQVGTVDTISNPDPNYNPNYSCGGTYRYFRLTPNPGVAFNAGPLSLSLSVNSLSNVVPCSSDFCAGMFTSVDVTCASSTQTCHIFAPQTPDSTLTGTLLLNPGTPQIAVATQTVCTQAQVNVSGLASGGLCSHSIDPISGIVWQTTGSTATATFPTGSYTVTATNTMGGCHQSATLPVTIGTVIPITGDTSICNGGSTTLTASGGETTVGAPTK